MVDQSNIVLIELSRIEIILIQRMNVFFHNVLIELSRIEIRRITVNILIISIVLIELSRIEIIFFITRNNSKIMY